jgi:Trypsin-like peptidase domain
VLSHEGIVTSRTGAVLDNVSNQRVTTTRGAREAKIYQQFARSVVLIVTEGGMGSGVLIDRNGTIVTNWHVVGNNKQVGIVFKPKVEGQQPQKADIRRGQVVRVDQVADLALVKVSEVPAGAEPMPLGEMSEVAVGNDVHAIGHPTGEAWTYTKGFVSQVRNDYKWSGGQQQVAHQANVIQTQTPINPGNSGGPLISSEGRLVGINSFKSSGEGLNFAVAVNEVGRLMASQKDRLAKANEPRNNKANAGGECKWKMLERFDSEDGSSDVRVFDMYCKGKPSAVLITPYDIRKAITLDVAEPGSDKVAGRIVDKDRDGKWDLSIWDTKGKGTWDVVCTQVNGSLEPDRCEPYKKKS